MSAEAAAKQAALVGSIAKATSAELSSKMDEMLKMLATMSVSLASTEARMQVIEAASTGSGPKRATKATGAKAAAGAAKKVGAAAKKADDPTSKVINSMLYFRYMWVNDAEFREEWGPTLSEDLGALFESEVSITKKAAGTSERYSAEAQYLWKNVLADEQKKAIKSAYDEWNKATARAAEDGQLEQDE